MTTDEIRALLDKHNNILSEHFDCVQIMVSWLNPNNETESMTRGSGNWYARQGLAREFINKSQADNIGESVAEHLPESL